MMAAYKDLSLKERLNLATAILKSIYQVLLEADTMTRCEACGRTTSADLPVHISRGLLKGGISRIEKVKDNLEPSEIIPTLEDYLRMQGEE
jgi:hypothetical protein